MRKRDLIEGIAGRGEKCHQVPGGDRADRRLRGGGLPRPSGRKPYGRAAAALMPRSRRQAAPPSRTHQGAPARVDHAILLAPRMISPGSYQEDGEVPSHS
jgi:hypothetical protein